MVIGNRSITMMTVQHDDFGAEMYMVDAPVGKNVYAIATFELGCVDEWMANNNYDDAMMFWDEFYNYMKEHDIELYLHEPGDIDFITLDDFDASVDWSDVINDIKEV